MTSFDFEVESFDDTPLKSLNADDYRKILLKVLEGERFIPKDQLHSGSVASGDVFEDGEHYFINIRPDCDCIARGGKSQDEVELYLLRGDKLKASKVAKLYVPSHGLFKETDVETIIFAMAEGLTISFRSKELSIVKWGDWKEKRVGSLLPPFPTRLHPQYPPHSQNPPLTTIPKP